MEKDKNVQEYNFKDFLVAENDNFHYYYTQMLLAKKIRKNNVVYIFDEVGCGKTTSAIVAISEVICGCKNNNKKANILIITPKSVCNQFYNDELLKKINMNVDGLKINIYPLHSVERANTININLIHKNHYDNDVNIYLINKERIKNIVDDNERWDLIVIDEAHDIVCNNKEQFKIFENKERINEYYQQCLKKHEWIEEQVSKFSGHDMDYIKFFYCNYFDAIPHEKYRHRLYKTHVFQNISKLNAEKVIFVTATPYKESLEIDYCNYTLLATFIIDKNKNVLYTSGYKPNTMWIDKIYGNENFDYESLVEMEDSNVSYSFKEITMDIPYDIGKCKFNTIGKKRTVELIRERDVSLKDKIQNIILEGKKNILKNRVLVFVSSSDEGNKVFKKIFDSSNHDIVSNHYYKDPNSAITCEFLMNKFGNSYKLRDYKKENIDLPDVLIVTYQVAQVGVNLPTYNYVINYTISDQPGSLEQRYGRIDRLNSKYDSLHNIYYLDNDDTNIYAINLSLALYRYQDEILNSKIPVKNLLLGENLDFETIDKKSVLIDLERWTTMFVNIEKKPENKIKMSESIISKINSVDNTLLDRCRGNNNSNNFIYDEISCELENVDNSDPDIDGTNANKAKLILNANIEKLIETYNKYDEYNKKIAILNDKKFELGNPGSIIYLSKTNNKKISIACKDIAKRIVELKNIHHNTL